MAAIVQLTQGCQEWLDYRLKMFNASETAAALGVSPWQTPYQLWLLKTGRSNTKATAAMQHGTEMEPAARAAYELHTGKFMKPLVLKDGRYSASLDGMNLQGDLILEVKCPYQGQASVLWQDAVTGQVPEHYRLQVQHQLFVSGATLGHLWVFADGKGLCLPIERDDLAMDRIQRGWEVFQGYLDTDVPPPLSDADTLVREDSDWAAAATAFAEANAWLMLQKQNWRRPERHWSGWLGTPRSLGLVSL